MKPKYPPDTSRTTDTTLSLPRFKFLIDLELDAPDQETAREYLDEMLDDLAVSTILNIGYVIHPDND